MQKDDTIETEEIRQKKEKLQNAVKSGELPLKLHIGRQDKHIEGTNNYKPEKKRSIVTISKNEIVNLVTSNYSEGVIYIAKIESRMSYKETLKAGKDIGLWYNRENNEYILTNRYTIHYSKTGYHIVPSNPKKDGEK